MTKIIDIWPELYSQAESLAEGEPLLASYYHASIISHSNFGTALASHVATKLGGSTVSALMLKEVFADILHQNPEIAGYAMADAVAYLERDPACDNYCRPFLFFKGFLAMQAQRFSHHLWQHDRKSLARYMQHQVSMLCDVDIHPGAKIGSGIMIDHATGLVIGETAVVGNNVSLLHGVTLGGTGNESGQRHPQVGSGVMISSGAKILGNITIGEGAKIGAGSVVLESVPPHVTVAGVPAKVIAKLTDLLPALTMNQQIEG